MRCSSASRRDAGRHAIARPPAACCQGKILGGSDMQIPGPDDPNDIVPHEHRRELRALRVFGAWTNLTDMKAGNTLDTVVTRTAASSSGITCRTWDRRSAWAPTVRTIGTRAGSIFYEGDTTQKASVLDRVGASPWQTAALHGTSGDRAIRGRAIRSLTWKPRVPTEAYIQMRDDDAFWAARRVMAFDDAMIRALVASGEYSDPAAAEQLAATLIARRDKIGRAYFTRINPIVDPVLDTGGALTSATPRFVPASRRRRRRIGRLGSRTTTRPIAPHRSASRAAHRNRFLHRCSSRRRLVRS